MFHGCQLDRKVNNGDSAAGSAARNLEVLDNLSPGLLNPKWIASNWSPFQPLYSRGEVRSGGTCSSTAFSLAVCGDAPVERQLITNPKCQSQRATRE